MTPILGTSDRSPAGERAPSIRRPASAAGGFRLHPWRRSLGCLFAGLSMAAALAAVSGGAMLPLESKLLAELAKSGTNAATLYALADVCHDAGAEGDAKAVVRAEGYLRQLLALQSTNAAAIALLGSVYTMKGRDEFWPNVQLRLVREGNEYMDRACRLDSNSIRVRLTRALNNAHMPDFLGRTDIVRADLAWLWEKIEKDPAAFTVHQRQQVALHWGQQLRRQDRLTDARRVWERGRAFDPRSRDAFELGTQLEKLP